MTRTYGKVPYPTRTPATQKANFESCATNCETSTVKHSIEKYVLHPFKTDKTAANGNVRQCLKCKPQAKCR